ncbi:peptidase domain-containing ABC transporter [Azospirillum halopraeferens]|uniref:peptidase domain-containing ABC transporter n=1 Tax=Azospirillum halopraeferens TaxID=34010 RepID=UPI001FDFC8CC|nr:peptidase domain-containing ABC transporter [Azospirillum halopraeferens]
MADPGQIDSTTTDSALQALIQLAALRGVHLPVATIRRDYPATDGTLPFPILAKIAERYGLQARVATMRWDHLAKLAKALPVMLGMRNGGAMILVRFLPGGPVPVAQLRDPLDPTQTIVSVDELRLTEAWDGRVLLLKRRFGEREADRPFGLVWLIGQVLREKRIFRDIAISAFILSLFALAPIFIYMVIIDKVLTYQRESTLLVLAVVIGFILFFDTLFGYVRRYLVAIASARIDARLSVYVFNRLIGLPIDFFERRPTGEIVYKVNEIWRIRNFLTGQLFTVLLDMMTLLVIIPLMFWLSPLLTFIALGIGFLMCVVMVAYLRPMARAYTRVVVAETRKNSFMIENIHGIRTVKSLAVEELRRTEWDARVAEAVRAHTAMQMLANQPQTILQPLEKLIFSGTLLVGAYIALEGTSTIMVGTLVAVTMLANRLVQPFVQTAQLLQQYEEVRGALNMVASVVNTEPEQLPGRRGVQPVITGHIEFQDLRFRYAGAESPALDNLSFNIARGKIIGIMGRSGSGKTTVTRLLQGLHRNYEGLIKIDGVDLREIDLTHLRSHIGVVLQDNFLFTGTIRDNIMAANRSATLNDVIRAARLAGAEEFIDRLPMGYETWIEEGSTNLSGGQRQRLAIARALLVDPKVLILDEATSALDPDSEAIVNNNLLRIASGRTVIVISHRLTSLVACDSIMVMERGKLIDMGTHRDLLRRCQIYSHLWSQQNRHIA